MAFGPLLNPLSEMLAGAGNFCIAYKRAPLREAQHRAQTEFSVSQTFSEAVSEWQRNVGYVIAVGLIPPGCRDRVGDDTRCGPRPPARSIGAKACAFPVT